MKDLSFCEFTSESHSIYFHQRSQKKTLSILIVSYLNSNGWLRDIQSNDDWGDATVSSNLQLTNITFIVRNQTVNILYEIWHFKKTKKSKTLNNQTGTKTWTLHSNMTLRIFIKSSIWSQKHVKYTCPFHWPCVVYLH